MVRRHRAGRRAARRYSELRKLWLRRTRRSWVKAAALFTAIALVANLSLLWLPSTWTWNAGVITGGLVAMFVAAREEPPGYIAQWQLGSWGEQNTEKALRPLEGEGWQVHHDLAAAYGNANIDHVVIGPGGVFLLDSKWWVWDVSVDGDEATLRRLEDPSLIYRYDARKGIIPLAMDVRNRLKAGTRASQYVQAVVVVWGKFPQQVAGDKCMYVHGDHLASWLREQPLRVAPERIKQFSAALR